jgi:hypothetical protein
MFERPNFESPEAVPEPSEALPQVEDLGVEEKETPEETEETIPDAVNPEATEALFTSKGEFFTDEELDEHHPYDNPDAICRYCGEQGIHRCPYKSGKNEATENEATGTGEV